MASSSARASTSGVRSVGLSLLSVPIIFDNLNATGLSFTES